jgi:hypothetical protein
MIKALEEAIEKVKTLSEERQQYAPEILEQIAAAGDEVYRLSDEERQLVPRALVYGVRSTGSDPTSTATGSTPRIREPTLGQPEEWRFR